MKKHSVLIGSIGGDAHSVGISILRHALRRHNYQVLFLGTQNKLEDFFHFADFANVVMISNMDGHAREYLKNFSSLYKKSKTKKLWYLGGKLEVNQDINTENDFLEMGFNRVFIGFKDLNEIIYSLSKDLANINPSPDQRGQFNKMIQKDYCLPKEINKTKDWLDERKNILRMWKTGKDAEDLNKNAKYASKRISFSEIQIKNKTPIIHPRSGVAEVDEQLRIFKNFQKEGIKVLSYQIDSFTRNNNYTLAEAGIKQSKEKEESVINGFPIVNHGVPALKKICKEIDAPFQVRHSTRDPRLMAEIAYAGGVTSFEGGCICYNIPYYKNYPLDEAIHNWQYVDRLTGLYYEKYGIILDREFFGTLTATLIPPSIAILVNIIEAILAVEQGVKCISLGYAEQGNRIQDIAAAKVLKSLTKEMLDNLGFKDIQINTVFHQYMAAFPHDYKRACELIYQSAITAAISGATRIMTKTPVEAYKIPSLSENIEGIKIVKKGLKDSKGIKIDNKKVKEEENIIKKETELMLNSLHDAGKGNLSKGIVKGFKKGLIDIPFSPSIYNQGKIMTARDSEGAVRFLDIGNLAFDKKLKEFHEDKMNSRRKKEGFKSKRRDYMLVESDVLMIPRGKYETWPLS